MSWIIEERNPQRSFALRFLEKVKVRLQLFSLVIVASNTTEITSGRAGEALTWQNNLTYEVVQKSFILHHIYNSLPPLTSSIPSKRDNKNKVKVENLIHKVICLDKFNINQSPSNSLVSGSPALRRSLYFLLTNALGHARPSSLLGFFRLLRSFTS